MPLADGDVFDLRIGPVVKRLGDTAVRMLAYNGSIPGPSLRVRQGSEVMVIVANQGDLDATVHWHGLRLDNRFDGTHQTQHPIPVGGSFTYRISFPDPGIYWYHPHIRQDYGQEMGLYGTIVVPRPTRTTGRRCTARWSSPWTTCCWKTARSLHSAGPRRRTLRWAASVTCCSSPANRI